ncbi:MAG: M17 family peptidase N-terminal domain-containing protein [Myxococcota bacterium]
MAERLAVAEIEVAPLDRGLLDGVLGPTGVRQGVDLAVLPCFTDERPLQGLAGLVDWRMGGRLSAMLREGLCTGDADEAVLLPGCRTLPIERLIMVGLGPSSAFDRALAEATGQRLVTMVERLAPRDVLVAMPGRVSERAVVEAVFDGLTRALRFRRPDDAIVAPAVRAVGDDAAVAVVVDPPPSEDPPVAEDGVVPLEAMGEGGPAERTIGVAPPAVLGGDGHGRDHGSRVRGSRVRGSRVRGSRVRGSPVGGSQVGGSRVAGAGPSSAGPRRWWVVADPRHEARLRRLLEGPPRAAERGA